MAILDILKFPDERLRTKAVPVHEITPELKKIAMDMVETMYHAKGVGLAATQVGVPYRLVIVDTDQLEKGPHPKICFNPEIIEFEGEEKNDEGCLSVPDFTAPVKRFTRITVRYTDIEGRQVEADAEEFEARAFQHEIDHLNGILFIDHLSKLRRELYLKRLKKAMEQKL